MFSSPRAFTGATSTALSRALSSLMRLLCGAEARGCFLRHGRALQSASTSSSQATVLNASSAIAVQASMQAATRSRAHVSCGFVFMAAIVLRAISNVIHNLFGPVRGPSISFGSFP